MIREIQLCGEGFDPNGAMDRFSLACDEVGTNSGGIASFLGKVRGGDATKALELLQYEKLTLSGMEQLADKVAARFELDGLLIIHRFGVMKVGEPIVLVATASKHRRAAIEAVDFAMDHLKSNSWFWKRELREDGWHWIEPREEDHGDLARWANS